MQPDDRNGLRVYRFASLPSDRIDAFVTTRKGGRSGGKWSSLNLGLRVKDDAETVVANRRALFAAYDLSLDRSVWCLQEHKDVVTEVFDDDAGRGATSEQDIVPGTDALITKRPALTMCVTLADCVPVVIYDPVHHVAGLVHAGWQGTVRRIASKTLARMSKDWGTDAADVLVGIGPSIAKADYQVDSPVIDAAAAAFGDDLGRVIAVDVRDGKGQFDLWEANALDLEQAGVARTQIEIAGMSTAAALDEFYSHRVERGADAPTGRFITAVTLRP